jgi:Peptidase M10 serralysin C terminal
MTAPSQQDEVAFISSVNADGTLAQHSYYGWDGDTPATYTSGWTTARKWGGSTAGTSGGTVSYYFDPSSNWSATEQKWFVAGLALWSAVANINFAPATSASAANITFIRTNNGGSYTYPIYSPTPTACLTGGTVLGTMIYAWINIDTTGTAFGPITGLASQGGFTIENLLHEEGHALGLGHAGPYNGSINAKTQQYSPYDNRRWSIMSYIDPGNTSAKYYSQTPVKGGFGGAQPTTMMPLDILAIQRLYGVPTSTPLSGGQVFGFNTNVTGAIQPFFDFTQNTKPVITIWDKGTNNTLDLSGFTGTATVNLNPGTFSSAAGLTNNIGIAFGTHINALVCTAGGTNVTCNNAGDTVTGGNGNDTIHGGNGNDTFNPGLGTNVVYGGGGTDTVVFSGNYASYTIVHNSNGTITVTGSSLKDTLSSIEFLKFADMEVSAKTAGTVLATGGVPPANSSVLSTSSAPAASSSALVDTGLDGDPLTSIAPQAAGTMASGTTADLQQSNAAQVGWDPASLAPTAVWDSTLSNDAPDRLTPMASTAIASPLNGPTLIPAGTFATHHSALHAATM